MAGEERQEFDPATLRPDVVAAGNLGLGVVGPLEQDIRADGLDQCFRRYTLRMEYRSYFCFYQCFTGKHNYLHRDSFKRKRM